MLRSALQFAPAAFLVLGIVGCTQPEWKNAQQFEDGATCGLPLQEARELAESLGATWGCGDDPLNSGCSAIHGRTQFLVYFDEHSKLTNLLRYRRTTWWIADRSGDEMVYSKEVCTGRRLDVPET